MEKWETIDIIVLIITIVVALILLIAMVKPLITGEELSTDSYKLIAGLMGSLIAIVSMYVGSKIQKNNHK